MRVKHQLRPRCTQVITRRRPTFFLFFVWLTCLVPLQAQESPVPPDLQAAIFQKVFSYDRTLPSGTDPHVLIAFSSQSTKLKDRLLEAFEGEGIKASAKLDNDIASIMGVNVLYVATERRSFKQLCQQNSVLSITGFPSLVEKGEVAVGLATNGGKPKIVVHRTQLRAEGHELAAGLLKLARLID